MTNARFEDLTRRALRKYHSADALQLSPDSFKGAGAGARVSMKMSVLSAAAAVILMISVGISGLLAVRNADDEDIKHIEQNVNAAGHSDFNSTIATLRIDGRAVILPLTIGRLSEYAELYRTEQNGGSYLIVFCKKGTKDICFTALADSPEVSCPIRELYVKSTYEGADILKILGVGVGEGYGSIVEDYYHTYSLVRHIPIDAYQSGSAALCRRGKNGSAVYFETDDYTHTLSGIRIVFNK